MDTQRPSLRDRGFTPPRCPRTDCSAHTPGQSFRWRRKGFFTRRCDGYRIQRFLCLICARTFSSQSFALDYRLKHPDNLEPIFLRMTDKGSLRRTSREQDFRRDLVEHRLELLGSHCKEFHEHAMERIEWKGGLDGPFLMDELETFETDRKLKPVTVPVLIAGGSGFILHVDVAPLPARGNLKPAERRRLKKLEAVEGKRRSGSTRVVRSTFEVLARVVPKEGPVVVRTDRKQSYCAALRFTFGDRLEHVRVHSKEHRGTSNPLFLINHTLARLRDLISRLVRRSWCASKKRARLLKHLWIVVAFRNYVDGWRSEPAWKQATSAAAQIGLEAGRLSAKQFLRWRDPLVAR